MKYAQIIKKLKSLANKKNVLGMARFGINPKNTLGVSVPNLRELAKKIGRDHDLAQKLWASGIHEARILAGMIDEIERVTGKQMDKWIGDFDSWDVCDQVCMNLFDKTPFAYSRALEYTKKKREFEKRAGFALMASLAFHDKNSPNKKFEKFFPAIRREATDKRNYVRKAVNWALRQIGKRNKNLNRSAIRVGKEILKINNKTAQWIAKDAIRELENKKF